MPLLILRPLATAIIEYFLAFRVFKKGHVLPIATTLFLVALGTYQFAEFLFLLNTENRFWLAVSLFSTTMLPPYGLLLIEKLSHRKTFYALFFFASLVLGLTFLFVPSVIPGARECNCFTKLDSSTLSGMSGIFYSAWGWYYFLSLSLSMLLICWHILKKHGDTKKLFWLLIGYATFFPASFLLVTITNSTWALVASVMCALAIICAFVITHIEVSGDSKNSGKTGKLKNKKTVKKPKKL